MNIFPPYNSSKYVISNSNYVQSEDDMVIKLVLKENDIVTYRFILFYKNLDFLQSDLSRAITLYK